MRAQFARKRKQHLPLDGIAELQQQLHEVLSKRGYSSGAQAKARSLRMEIEALRAMAAARDKENMQDLHDAVIVWL
jgi:hypothetical protein